MKKTSTRLADGRELIYYDAEEGTVRAAEDRRPLEPARSHSELRYDPLLDSWVIYASHRQDRSFLPAAVDCPFCPSRGDRLTEIPESDYEVAVFENRFPALSPPASGRCEVVCYTSDHEASFADLSAERVDLVLEALIDRTAELGALPGVEQVFCFENRGEEVGVTQPHPHGQIYAYPFVTLRTEKMLAAARAHRRRTRANLFDALLASEREARLRVVLSTQHWTAFVPHAAHWPYEVHLYPNERVLELAALADGARRELPGVLLDLFGRFARLFSAPAPYIAAWHQAPVREGRRDFACHLELLTLRRADDKLKYLAASESAMDAFTGDILPEAAAERLRELAR